MNYVICILLALLSIRADAGNCEYPEDLDSRGHVCGKRATRANQ